MILPWLAVACSPEPAPLPFDRPHAPVALRLLDTPAQYALGDATLPGDLPQGGRFALTEFQEVDGPSWDRVPAWYAPLPVRLPKPSYFAAPDGVALHRELQVMDFANLPGPWDPGVWDIRDDHLIVAWPNDPGDAGFELVSEATVEAATRRDPRRSGLPPETFVQLDATLDHDTRPALLLPAPSTATWSVELPARGTLRFGVGLLEPLLRTTEGSDGAEVVVRIDGDEVSRVAARAGSWTEVEVRIERPAGPATLELATDPGASTLYDHVVVSDPTLTADASHPPRRVVLVGIDTLRWDAFTQHGYPRDTTTPLDALAGQSVLFQDTYTPAPRTRPSFRTALTGRWPLEAFDAATLGERLRAEGFATRGIVSNVHLVPRFGFHRGYGAWRIQSDQDATDQVARALSWLEAHQDTDSLLFLHLIDPHVFYRAPGEADQRYEAGHKGPLTRELNRWDITGMAESGQLDDDHKEWLRARYDNEVRFAAEALAGFVEAVDELPGETVFVLFTDHGEEFWDHGGYEHNHTLYQELVHGALWVRPPGGVQGPLEVSAATSLADIVPTILELVGAPLDPELDGRSLVPTWAEAAAPPVERALPLGHAGYARETWGVVTRGHKYTLRTWDGREELYDLRADPDEQQDLATAQDLAPWREALADATGWPVGTGLRLELRRLEAPLQLHFSGPVEAAWLVEPEAGETRRANEEWGERPRRLPHEVATVTVSDDHRVVTIEPGPELPDAMIAVRFEGELQAELVFGGDRSPLSAAGQLVSAQGLLGRVDPGPLIQPLDSVRDHLDAAWTQASTEALEELEALGYVQ